jgi:uncharacterized protein (DUF1810 family)
MTLFASAAPDNRLFQDVLDQYFGSVRDIRTERLLASGARHEPPTADGTR